MEDAAENSPGFVESARRLRDEFSRLAHDRLALAAVEVHEEKYRLIQIFIWISAGIFTAMLTLIFASLTVVYIFWDKAPLGVLIGLTVFYVLAVGAILLGFRGLLARQPKLFENLVEPDAHPSHRERDES